jgi:hypothetical protein
MSGVFSFGYFSLDKQRKATRPRRAKPSAARQHKNKKEMNSHIKCEKLNLNLKQE